MLLIVYGSESFIYFNDDDVGLHVLGCKFILLHFIVFDLQMM